MFRIQKYRKETRGVIDSYCRKMAPGRMRGSSSHLTEMHLGEYMI